MFILPTKGGWANTAFAKVSKPTTALKISKNFSQGEKIETFEKLIELAKSKKSVYHKVHGIRPAAFYIHWPLIQVSGLIKNGRLFETEKIK